MNDDNKRLLLKDLCARLPYGVKCKMWFSDNAESSIVEELKIGGLSVLYSNSNEVNIVPYLRSIFKMSDEEYKELEKINSDCVLSIEDYPECIRVVNEDQIDWLNSHHIDYRGLIKKGIAIEAPDGMYV